VTFPKGHFHNPMTADELNAKFDDAASGVVSDETRDTIKAAWWGFDQAKSLPELIATMKWSDAAQ
jgi:2-methylcitrate dehydratase PrpD